MKLLKILLPLIVAVTLAVGISLPGLAAPEGEEPQTDNSSPEDVHPAWGWRLPKMQAGKVTGIDVGKSYFIVQRGEDEPVEIAVDDGTKYFMVSAPRMLAGLLRHRRAPEPQNEAEASGIRPAAPKKPKPLNAGWLKKIKGFDQLVSTPMAATGPSPVGLMRKGRGFGQVVSTPMAAPMPSQVEGKGIGKNGRWNLQRFRRFGEEATFDDIHVGDRVAVRLVPGQDKPVARLVLIFEPSPYKRIAGTITDVSSDNTTTITIAPSNEGEAVTLNYNEDTVFYLKGTIEVVPGQLARAVYEVEGMLAKMVRVWPEGTTEFGEPGDWKIDGN